MVFQYRIINPRISLASSRLRNSQASGISPPKPSGEYSLGITVSGPAMRAAKNPSSASTFIALPPLQPLRKSPRRSSSASVSGSFCVKVLMGKYPNLAYVSTSNLSRCSALCAKQVTFSPRLPIQPFLYPRRTPLFQCPQQLRSRLPRQHQPSVLRLQKSLLHRMVEHRQQGSVIPQDIQDAAGLRVQTELSPRHDLAELLQSSESARQCHECVRQVSHERLAFVHRVHNVKFRQSLVPDLALHKVFGDDSHCLAARPQHRVREHTHQTHVAAAVYQADVAPCQFHCKLLGGSAVLGAAPLTGAAENADSFHAAILKLAFVNARLNAPSLQKTEYYIAIRCMASFLFS